MMDGHIYKLFDEELRELKEKILLEGSLVESAIHKAIKSLLDRDSGLARRVIEDDGLINIKDVEIDEFCLRLLALRQPAARDLRFINAVLKINYDLERMGDIAVNICERVLELNQEHQFNTDMGLPTIAGIAQEMVKDSLDAFAGEDLALALKVEKDEEAVDLLMDQIFRHLLAYMLENPSAISAATKLIFVAKSVERLADHALNIALLVVFLKEGRIVRHLKPRTVAARPADCTDK
jgi:phosphate transport system protein